MSLLRERMIEDMRLHGFSASTQDVYVRAVRQLSEYVHHGPDKVTEEELRGYFLYLEDPGTDSDFKLAVANRSLSLDLRSRISASASGPACQDSSASNVLISRPIYFSNSTRRQLSSSMI